MKQVSFKQSSFRKLSIRAETHDNGKKYIEGIIPYNSKSVPMWGTTEIIDRTAFNKTLADKTEVKALVNHNDSFILGNTKSGTLSLETTDTGLVCRCELPNTSYANDLFEVVNRGDVSTMSFGFNPIKWIDNDNGKTRTLKEVKLVEISFGVSFPAYQETNSQVFLRGFMKRNIDIEKLNEILSKEDALTTDEITSLQEIVDTITTIITANSAEEEVASKGIENERTIETTTTEENTEIEDKKEEIKQEILDIIDQLFEDEKDIQ